MNKSGANSQTGQTVLSHIHDPELRCAALCKALLHSGTISDFSAQMHIYEIYVETSLPKLIFFRETFFCFSNGSKWESSHAGWRFCN